MTRIQERHSFARKTLLPALACALIAALALAGPARAGDNLKQGRAALERHDIGTALALLQRAVVEEPGNLDAHSAFALALVQGHRSAEAKGEIEACSKINAESEVIPYLEGRLAESQEDWDGAIAKYRAAIARRSKYADASYSLGMALRHQGKSQDGLAELNRGLDFARENDVPRFLSGIGLALMDMDSLSAAADSATRAVALDPDNVLTHVALGQIYLKRGVYSLAKMSLDRAVQLDTLDPVVYFQLGKANYYSQQYSDALQSFKTAAALDTLYADPQYWIGHLYVLAGVADREKYSLAAPFLRTYTRLRPGDSKGWLDLGEALYRSPASTEDEFKESAAALDKSSAINGNESKAYLLMVKVSAYKLKDFDKAFAAYNRMQAAGAKLSADDILLVASLYTYKSMFPQADSVIAEAIKADTTAPDGWFKMAESKFFQREYAAAIPFLQKRIDVDSTGERSKIGVAPFLPYYMLGQAYNQIQKYDSSTVFVKMALAHADSATTKPVDLAKMHLELGTAYAKGDSLSRELAKGEFASVIEADSTSQQAVSAMYNMGYTDFAAKKYRESAEMLERAQGTIERNSPPLKPRLDVLLLLASSYVGTKDYDRAREVAKKGLALDPTNNILSKIAAPPAPVKSKPAGTGTAPGGASAPGAAPSGDASSAKGKVVGKNPPASTVPPVTTTAPKKK